MKTIAATVIMGLLLLYVWERVDLVRLGYRAQQLKAKHHALQRAHDELRVQVSALRSPERIGRIAMQQLGMTRPVPGQVVLVSLTSEMPGTPDPVKSEVRLARNDAGQ